MGQSLRGEHVVTVLNRLTARRGAPTVLFCDNGSEFGSQIVDLWARALALKAQKDESINGLILRRFPHLFFANKELRRFYPFH